MSVERDSIIDQAIELKLTPKELAKATLLAGELAWSADDVLHVIEHLANTGYAIVGVELWQNIEGHPKWIATSNYKHDEIDDKCEYASLCAKSAKGFVNHFKHTPGALFNLS